MGFNHLGKKTLPKNATRHVAVSLLENSLGVCHAGYSRRNPEIHVQMINQVVRIKRNSTRAPFWFQRLCRYLNLW